MTLRLRLPLLLVIPLLAACATAPIKPPATLEIAPAAPPAADAPPAPTADPVQRAAAAKPSSTRPTTLPGTTIRFEGGDGSSQASAILILGAKGERDGVDSEYQYLDLLYGPRPAGWTMVKQSLLEDADRSYDALEIERAGKSRTVYFDITDYFGKF